MVNNLRKQVRECILKEGKSAIELYTDGEIAKIILGLKI